MNGSAVRAMQSLGCQWDPFSVRVKLAWSGSVSQAVLPCLGIIFVGDKMCGKYRMFLLLLYIDKGELSHFASDPVSTRWSSYRRRNRNNKQKIHAKETVCLFVTFMIMVPPFCHISCKKFFVVSLFTKNYKKNQANPNLSMFIYV